MARLPMLLTTTLVFLLLQCMVNAQDTASLPSCAKDCANTAAIAVGCSLTDAPCLCKTKNFTNATLQCATKTCTKEDQSSAGGVLTSMCNSVTTSSSTSTTTTTTNATPSPPITTRGSSTSITSATSTVTSSSSTPSSSSSSISTTTTSSLPTVTSPGSTLSIPPPSTTVVLSTSTLGTIPTNHALAAGMNGVERVGAMGALVVGMLALL